MAAIDVRLAVAIGSRSFQLVLGVASMRIHPCGFGGENVIDHRHEWFRAAIVFL
jgi:hypothetical protein